MEHTQKLFLFLLKPKLILLHVIRYSLGLSSHRKGFINCPCSHLLPGKISNCKSDISHGKRHDNRPYSISLLGAEAQRIASQIVVTRKDAPASSAHDLPLQSGFFSLPDVMHTPAGVLMLFSPNKHAKCICHKCVKLFPPMGRGAFFTQQGGSKWPAILLLMQ